LKFTRGKAKLAKFLELTANEMQRIFENLSGKYKIEFIFPERFHLNKEELNKVEPMLRQIDYICFYLERLA